MITNDGKADIATSYILAKYTTIKIGDGADSTSASQTKLDHLVTTKLGQSPTVVGSTIIWNVDFLGSEIPSSGISEIGIFHVSSDKLLTRITFTSTGGVAASDTVTFTIRIGVN